MSNASLRRSSLSRPVHAVDVEQARLFAARLQCEVDELEQLITVAETRWLRRCARRESDRRQPPDSLSRFRERLSEVQKLLKNLQTRFPLD